MSHTEKTDEALVTATLRGELEAFSMLVRRYERFAHGAAVGVISDYDLARDAAQDAFVCAFRKLAELRDRACFAPWLHSIVKRTAYGVVRERKRLQDAAAELHLTGSFLTGRSHTDGRALVRKLPGALRRLSPAQREAVVLHYLESLSYADIARYLGVPEATVLGRLQRARERHKYLPILCRIRPESASVWLAEGLRSTDSRLRWRACTIAFIDNRTPPLAACVAAAHTKLDAMAREIVGLLVLQHGELGRQALEELLENGTPYQKMTAALGLATVGHPAAFEALKADLLNPCRSHRWRARVSKTLCRYYPDAVCRWVEKGAATLTHAHGVAWTLARTDRTIADGTLQTLYRDGTPAVRAAALRMMVEFRGAAMIGELRKCLRAGKPRKVAHVAVKALRRLRPAADAVVREMLGSEYWTERKAAVSILRRWGELTDAMRAKAGEDPHPGVCASATV